MPTYEYECRDCRHRFERFQSITARPVSLCPRCKGKAKRLISSGVGLLFKGSGFYITDYRSSNYKKQAQAEAPKESATEPKPSNSATAKKSESRS